jgi:hypothetical protein
VFALLVHAVISPCSAGCGVGRIRPCRQVGAFTVSGGAGFLTRADNNNVSGTGVAGIGSFTTTTAGRVVLTFTGAKSTSLGVHCQSPGKATGEIVTTELEFHVITVTKKFQES